MLEIRDFFWSEKLKNLVFAESNIWLIQYYLSDNKAIGLKEIYCISM
jgi:hypothetical protein